MTQKTIMCLLLAAVSSLVSCAPMTIAHFDKDNAEKLSQQQLQELLSENVVELAAADFDATLRFSADNRVAGKSRTGGEDKGKWKATDNDLLCMKFKKWYFGDEKCYQVFRTEQTKLVFFTPDGVRYYSGTMPALPGPANIDDFPPQEADLSESAPDRGQEVAGEHFTDSMADKMVRLARNCPGCKLSGVDLRGANLIGANLRGADLSFADLSRANLRRADLSGANLSGAKLLTTNLPGADLSGCNVTNADLRGANLTRAVVHDADFKGADLTGALLNSIQGTIE
ncbi:pentapeptide repeat-containing protein [Desulforhopalus singaporensis]|uniref:Pentapeptide repeat-containing protein n=1 Tax=Desulforhopalus singaporensis TaxID=91360 RepID=A0A1H0MX48_9BACT|nr:pentapeptide repeat-containing protein [Desulforhopalus singaporensis]SDO84700.1 Pentapeptide repeat-containing protein [Desulforhopalus singaporensis]